MKMGTDVKLEVVSTHEEGKNKHRKEKRRDGTDCTDSGGRTYERRGLKW
jgi:hypothetical protein